MSFNNGYYFFEHADDKVSGYIMFRKTGQTVRVQVLVENLNIQADTCSVFLSNTNSDKLYLSDIPLKKQKNGRKTVSGDIRYDESKKPEIRGFDCAHIVVGKKSVLEAFSGSIRQFDRDMFLDKKKPVTVIPNTELKRVPENKPNNTAKVEKPEIKPTPKLEVKPEIKPTPKPEIKPEIKPTPKPEIKPEIKPTPKPEIKPEIKPTTKPESKIEIMPEPKSEPKFEIKHEHKLEPAIIPEEKNNDEVVEKTKPKWEWDESYSDREIKAEDIHDKTKTENYPDDIFDKMLTPFDPFNTTNKAYSWWVADNFKATVDAFSSVDVTVPSIISKFLYNNIENYKHALIGRYIQDGRKFIILGIPSEKYAANSVARWMKCSTFYTNTEFTGYLLYYIDARSSSLVKAVQAD